MTMAGALEDGRVSPSTSFNLPAEYNLYAVPFDLGAASVVGGAVSVLTGVHMAGGSARARRRFV